MDAAITYGTGWSYLYVCADFSVKGRLIDNTSLQMGPVVFMVNLGF